MSHPDRTKRTSGKGVVAPAKAPKYSITEITGRFPSALRGTKRNLVGQALFPSVACGADFGARIRKQSDEYCLIIR
jgi:hypothetical protein